MFQFVDKEFHAACMTDAAQKVAQLAEQYGPSVAEVHILANGWQGGYDVKAKVFDNVPIFGDQA